MKLLEYKGKELLKDNGIPIQQQAVVDSISEVSFAAEKLKPPYVLKAQINTGGRGKAGGIKFAGNIAEAEKLAGNILGMSIKGSTVKRLLITEKVEVKDEWYLSIIIDRVTKSPDFSPIISPVLKLEFKPFLN